MRYKLMLLLVSLLILSGCQGKNENELESRKLENYKSNISDLLVNNATESTSQYFSVSTEVSELPDGTFRYYLIVDNAMISMYDVKMMVLDVNSDSSINMAPSIGILDDEKYNLVPSQVAKEAGFVKGLVLSGDSDHAQIDLKLMVSWTDESYNKKFKEYLSIQCEPAEKSGD